jgi:hypothetical protein
MKDKPRTSQYIRLIAWIIALSVRCLFPLADPPADLSWSGGYYADEGFWVHNARNETLFESPVSDQWNNKIVSPTTHFPVKLLFHFLGANLLTVRLWGMILAILTLFFLDRITRRLDPSGFLFLLFALNSFLVAYQRIAILESSVLPIAAFVMWSWLLGQECRGGRFKVLLDVMTGIAAAWTWQIKTTQLYFIPLVIAASWLSEPSRKRAVMTVFRQAFGAGIAAAVWFWLIRFPNQVLLQQYNRFYMSQHGDSWQDIIRNLTEQPLGVYFNRLPLLLSSAFLMTGLIMIKRRFQLMPPALVFAWLWLVIGMVSLMPMGYRPVRYYVPLLIPITILGYRFVTSRDTMRNLNNISILSKTFLLAILWLPTAMNLPILADFLFLEGAITGLTAVPGFSLIGAITLLMWCIIWSVVIACPKRMSERFMSLSLVFCILFQSAIVGQRLFYRSYDVLETSRDLAEFLPDNSVLAGQWAPQLVLETPFRAVPIWKNFVNWDNPFEEYGVTHILSWEYPLGNELEHHQNWFPEYMNQARFLKTYNVKNSIVSLRKVLPVHADSQTK